MTSWDPAQYLRFADLRRRPALELMVRVPLAEATTIYDLGCGTGNITKILAERWPQATVVGVDSSAEMLAEAGKPTGRLRFEQADLARWQATAPADLIFSNAALHWLDDHPVLFPGLVKSLKPGGWLAVQMPRNHGAASHTAMIAAAEAGPWAGRLKPVLRPNPVAVPAVYYDLLAPHADSIDIWETEYLQILDGSNPVVEWTKGTALRPLLAALEEPERSGFHAAYAERILAAYPPQADGRTLFPFRRLFLLARRKAP